jgi:hypothetical protein
LKTTFLPKSALIALLVCQNVEAKEVIKDPKHSEEAQNPSKFNEFIDTIIKITNTISSTDVPDSETVPDPQ